MKIITVWTHGKINCIPCIDIQTCQVKYSLTFGWLDLPFIKALYAVACSKL